MLIKENKKEITHLTMSTHAQRIYESIQLICLFIRAIFMLICTT